MSMTIEELRARGEDFLEKLDALPREELIDLEKTLLLRVQSDVLCGMSQDEAYKTAFLALADALLNPKKNESK